MFLDLVMFHGAVTFIGLVVRCGLVTTIVPGSAYVLVSWIDQSRKHDKAQKHDQARKHDTGPTQDTLPLTNQEA